MRPGTSTRPRPSGGPGRPAARPDRGGGRPRRPDPAPPTRKRRKDPLWARLTITFGALVMFASVLTVAVPKILTTWLAGNVERIDAIPPTLQGDNIDGAINFLLIGIDERKTGGMADDLIRADSLVLVHVPATHDRAYMISFPRDLRVAIPAMPASGYNGAYDKLAHAFAFGAMHDWVRDASKEGRERGTALTMQTISDLVPGGLQFHGAAIIDFEGFDAVVHALGSVYMCVDMDVWSIHYWPDGTKARRPIWGGLSNEPADGAYGEGFHYPEGWCGDMEPWQALDYARQRYGLENTDYDRQRHQQQLLKAIVEKIASPDTLKNFDTVISLQNAAGDLLTLDLNNIPLENWVITLSSLRPDDLVMIETYGGTFRSEQVEDGGQMLSFQRLDPDLVELLEHVRNDRVMDFLVRHPDWVAPTN